MLDIPRPIFAFTRIHRINTLAYLRQQEQHARRTVPTAEVRPGATPGHQIFWSAFGSEPGDYAEDFKRLKLRDGARERAGAALGLHMLVGVSGEWLEETGDLHDAANPRLHDLFKTVKTWAEASIGGVYAMRLDLDERGGGVVDVFAAPSFHRAGRPKKDGTRGSGACEISVKKALQGLQRKVGSGKSFEAAQTLWARHAHDHLDVRIVRGVPKHVTGRVHVNVPEFRQVVEECRELRAQRDGELQTLLTTVGVVDESWRSIADRDRAQADRDQELDRREAALDQEHRELAEMKVSFRDRTLASERKWLADSIALESDEKQAKIARQTFANNQAALVRTSLDLAEGFSRAIERINVRLVEGVNRNTTETERLEYERQSFDANVRTRERNLVDRERALTAAEARHSELAKRLRHESEELAALGDAVHADWAALDKRVSENQLAADQLIQREAQLRDREDAADRSIADSDAAARAYDLAWDELEGARIENQQAEDILDRRRSDLADQQSSLERAERHSASLRDQAESTLRAAKAKEKLADFAREELATWQVSQALERSALDARLAQVIERERAVDRQSAASQQLEDAMAAGLAAIEAGELNTSEEVAARPSLRPARDRLMAIVSHIEKRVANTVAATMNVLQGRTEEVNQRDVDLTAREGRIGSREQAVQTMLEALRAGFDGIERGHLRTAPDVDADPRYQPARIVLRRAISVIHEGVSRATAGMERARKKAEEDREQARAERAAAKGKIAAADLALKAATEREAVALDRARSAVHLMTSARLVIEVCTPILGTLPKHVRLAIQALEQSRNGWQRMGGKSIAD